MFPLFCVTGGLSHYVPGRCGSSINPFDAIWSGAQRGGTSQLYGFEVTGRKHCVIQRYYKGLHGVCWVCYMHRYGLVAAEDGEAPSAHMWQRMSNLSVAMLGDCVDFVPRRPVRTQVSVSWQVG